MKFEKMENNDTGKNTDENINKVDKETIINYKKIKSSLKKRSIKSELLFTMLSISVILTFGIIICVSTILSKNYDGEINNKNEMISNLISKNVSSFMDTAYKVTEELAFNSDIRSGDSATEGNILKNSVERNPYFELLYVQNETGMQTGRSSGELASRADRWWFIEEKDNSVPFISKSYYSVSSKNPVTSIFIPLMVGDKFAGVMGSDINLSRLQELIKENSDEEAGRYSFLIDGEGAVVAHPDDEVLAQLYNYKNLTKTTGIENGDGKTKEESIKIADGYKDIISQVMAGKSGSSKFEDNGENYYASYTPIKLDGESSNWSVITVPKRIQCKSYNKQSNTSYINCRINYTNYCSYSNFIFIKENIKTYS